MVSLFFQINTLFQCQTVKINFVSDTLFITVLDYRFILNGLSKLTGSLLFTVYQDAPELLQQ